METGTIVIIIIVFPIAMLFSAFFAARQVRGLFPGSEGTFKAFMSIFMGIVVGGIMLAVLLPSETPLWQSASISATLALVTAACGYIGFSLGWKPSKKEEKVAQPLVFPMNGIPENVEIIDEFGSLKITVHLQRRWWMFISSLIQIILLGFFALPIVFIGIGVFLQQFLPEALRFVVWIALIGLALYLLYGKFRELIGYASVKETIEIDAFGVKVELYGLGMKTKRTYPSENIKRITAMFVPSISGARFPFTSSTIAPIMIWHRRGIRRFGFIGRGIAPADAQTILSRIYQKFPQYKE